MQQSKCGVVMPICKNPAEYKSSLGYDRYSTWDKDVSRCHAHRGLHEFNFFWKDGEWVAYPRCKKEEERGDDNTQCTRNFGHEFPHWFPNKFEEADRKWIEAGRPKSDCELKGTGDEIPF